MGLFTLSFTGNQAKVQAKKTMFESLRYMGPFGKWMKFNTPDGKPVVPNGSVEKAAMNNTPIVVQREFISQNNPVNEMWIPVFRQLSGLGKIGNEILSGQEEERKINMAKVRINTLRHGELVKQGHLQAAILKEYGIPETSRKALLMQYARRMAFVEIPTAFYKGISNNVLNSTEYAADTTVATVSHPNFYVVGSGKVTQAGSEYPGNASYETNVAQAVAAIQPTHKLSASVLAGLNADEDIRRIPYLFTKDGKPFRVMVVHPWGMADLRKDADIKGLVNSVFVQNLAKENPMLTGMEIFYEGWAIFDGGNCVWPLSSDGSTITYGITATSLDSYNSYSGSSMFGAMILGDNALFHGIGWDMKWTGESRDHENIEAVGYHIGNGVARNDAWNLDDGSTGQYLINTSSAVLAHYATVPEIA